jgi:hypothetical protein
VVKCLAGPTSQLVNCANQSVKGLLEQGCQGTKTCNKGIGWKSADSFSSNGSFGLMSSMMACLVYIP